MSDLPREGPDGRIGSDGGPVLQAPPPARRAGELLPSAAAVSAAATMLQLGWQTDRLVGALDGAAGDLRTILVSNYATALWEALVGVAVAVAAVALRRSPRWAGPAWGALLLLAVLRILATVPALTGRLSLSVPVDPPTWLEATLLVAGLVSAALALASRPR